MSRNIICVFFGSNRDFRQYIRLATYLNSIQDHPCYYYCTGKMPSSEMERYIRKIDVTQLARVRRANENEEQIHSSFITSGWFSYNDPMHKYTKHYISNKNNNTKNQSNSSTLPIVPKKENCTKSQKFHFLYHKTLSDQSGNRYRNTRVVHTKRDGESNQSEVELLQVPTHEEFLHRDQMREKNGQNGNGRNTNREQILEWFVMIYFYFH